MKYTQTLNDLLKDKGYLKDDYELEKVLEMIQFYKNQYERIRSITGNLSAVASMAQAIDCENKSIPAEEAAKISCKKGCSYCCYYQVEITADEAEAIGHYCKKAKIRISKKYLKEQIKSEKNKQHLSKAPACVFLKNKLCSIYDVRPFRCRSHFVESDPRDCDAKTRPGILTAKLFNINLETMMNAVEAVSESGRMAKMLLPYSK